MFSKRAPEAPVSMPRSWRKPPSIALRMTAWYVLSAFALILVATGLLYLVLVNGM